MLSYMFLRRGPKRMTLIRESRRDSFGIAEQIVSQFPQRTWVFPVRATGQPTIWLHWADSYVSIGCRLRLRCTSGRQVEPVRDRLPWRSKVGHSIVNGRWEMTVHHAGRHLPVERDSKQEGLAAVVLPAVRIRSSRALDKHSGDVMVDCINKTGFVYNDLSQRQNSSQLFSTVPIACSQSAIYDTC